MVAQFLLELNFLASLEHSIQRGHFRHDQKLRFSKSVSRIEIYYSRLTLVISRLLIVNTMLPTH
jgi:hypothetical protein